MDAAIADGSVADVGGGDGGPPPDTPVAPDGGSDGGILFRRCPPAIPAPAECLDVEFPVDWNDPDGPTVTRNVLRMPARDPSRRLGVLFFNFGGPGSSTRNTALGAYPDSLLPGSAELADRFDWILLEWRGVVGWSPTELRLDCLIGTPLDMDRQLLPFVPRSPAEWTAHATAARSFQTQCTDRYSDTTLATLDTWSNAKDIEHVRALMGEPRIDLMSFSHGTLLAAQYAALFPERVRGFTLDSPIALGLDRRTYVLEQAAGMEGVLDRFFTWCATETAAGCSFAEATPEATETRWLALRDQLFSAPITTGLPFVFDGGRMVAATIGALYDPSAWVAFADALLAAELGEWEPLQAFAARVSANGHGSSTFRAISAVSYEATPTFTPETAVDLFTAEVDAIAPRLGAAIVTDVMPSLDWPVAASGPLPTGPTTAPPMLLTATRDDVSTPHLWSERLVTQLDNGSYLVTAETAGHISGLTNACVASAIVAFHIDPTTPPAATTCPE